MYALQDQLQQQHRDHQYLLLVWAVRLGFPAGNAEPGQVACTAWQTWPEACMSFNSIHSIAHIVTISSRVKEQVPRAPSYNAWPAYVSTIWSTLNIACLSESMLFDSNQLM